jgi:hypothetical protein
MSQDTEKEKKVIIKPRKVFWHLYSLQTLGPEKFMKVVDKILTRDFGVIK